MSSDWINEHATGNGNNTTNSIDSPVSNPFVPVGSAPRTRLGKVAIASPESKSQVDGLPLNVHDANVRDMEERLEAIRIAGATSKEDLPMSSSASVQEPTFNVPTRPFDSLPDAFTGQSLGFLAPLECDKEQEDLWAHLKQVKDLQADIALMHAQMEGLGGSDRRPRRRETTGDDEGINVEEEAKAAKAAEFKKLNGVFANRKDAIGAVMQKLDKLSSTIKEFHSSRTPILPFDSPFNDVTSPPDTKSTSTPQKPKNMTDASDLHDSPVSDARIL